MAGIILPRLRLEDLAGARLDAIQEPHLERLVKAQIEEDVDLDCKAEPYGPKDGDKRNLAGDAAAMANTRGGAIILGIGQLPRGRAGVLRRFRLDETEVQRMRQIVASLVFPTPAMEILPIKHPPNPTYGYYLLVVPRSQLAPHAVRMDNHSLRYPRRYGSETIYMSQSEVPTPIVTGSAARPTPAQPGASRWRHRPAPRRVRRGTTAHRGHDPAGTPPHRDPRTGPGTGQSPRPGRTRAQPRRRLAR